jgi:hypothetical protein
LLHRGIECIHVQMDYFSDGKVEQAFFHGISLLVAVGIDFGNVCFLLQP